MSESLKEKRILLVDDDQDILTSMQAVFEPTGAWSKRPATATKPWRWWKRISRIWWSWT